MSGAIGIPSRVESRWSLFWACLEALDRPPGTKVYQECGSAEAFNRRLITERALADGAEWIFWLDDDLVFRRDVLLRMLERPQALVIGLSLFRRPDDTGQFRPLWSHQGPHPSRTWDQVTRIETNTEGLMPLGAGTNGGMLTRRVVFDAIGVPSWKKHRFDPVHESCDVEICWRAAEAGIQPWGDPSVRFGHIAQMVVWPYEESGQWSTILAKETTGIVALPWAVEG